MGKLSSTDYRGNKPWWFYPYLNEIIFTERAIRRSGLHSSQVQKIRMTMAKAKFPTRSMRAKKSWQEPIFVDGVPYQLSCHVDAYEHLIVVTHIRVS